MKKISKNILGIAAIASMGISFSIADPGLVSAAPSNSTENNIKKEIKSNTSIEDWSNPFYDAGIIVGKNLDVPGIYAHTFTRFNSIKFEQYSVEADGSPTITDSEALFVGKSTLTNNTNNDQTLTTDSFSKTISNSVENSTTHGFSFGQTASAKFNVPLVGETGVELSTEYNFSNTNTHTESQEHSYIASPQNILVPANSAVEVIVKLDTVKSKGDVKLLTKMSGRTLHEVAYSTGIYNLDFDMNELVTKASKYEKLEELSANPDGRTVNLIGSGKYEAKYGTEFSVTVNPIDKNGKSLGQSYTYKVKPESTK
ncbi:sulfurtransferase [Bacillus cereus]|uniref:ETX/MTX2 family pore-forming toxin n=1 Tax=Bacillus cereus TaxID=1396 RepID=UPI000BEE28D3|nr:ETX/MTX2 family pore-forming toxin [Bacillus cereus]PED02880.1 sulfurtransferase [Bacillus cereus]PEQ74704.1 sulfurtransferase [Bacillus cereus]PEU06400.1 sulfurtransferase [Bacillus cereus]PEX30664.1 sulfurtransferase [Bacillus cereus]PEY14803.1 sulfurtransferase [Bacillus cereus]